MEPLKLHWEGRQIGWVLDTITLLSDHHIKYVIEKTVPIQKQRWRSLRPGDEKNELEYAIKLLEAGKIQQWIIPMGDGIAPFQSTERMQPTKFFY